MDTETISNLMPIACVWKRDEQFHVVAVNFGQTPIRQSVRISHESFAGRLRYVTELMLGHSEFFAGDDPNSTEIVIGMDPWAGRIIRLTTPGL